MELAGMVYLGEYSSGCICQVPGAHPNLGAAAAPAVVGVMTQMGSPSSPPR